MVQESFTAVRPIGGFFAAHFLEKIHQLQAPAQKPVDYGLARSGEPIQEAHSLRAGLAGHWKDFAEDRVSRERCAEVTAKWLDKLFLRLEFNLEQQKEAVVLDERNFPISHFAFEGKVPVLLVPADHGLDEARRQYGDGRLRTPFNLVQIYLNASPEAHWGLVSNGTRLRILRDNPSLTRQAYLEVDLEAIFEQGNPADLLLFWACCHASRFKPEGPGRLCHLETWREESQRQGERALNDLRYGVAEALRRLGSGFSSPRNPALRQALDQGRLSLDDFYAQLLRLVYRFIFLFTVEERDLLHQPDADQAARDLYKRGYSMDNLRARCGHGPSHDDRDDLWQGLLISFRALREGQPLLGLPALGGLFADNQCPDLENAALPNKSLLEAVRLLAYISGRASLTRVNYRDMDTEELGGIYETLLELVPQREPASGMFYFAGDLLSGDADTEDGKPGGHQRKLTGSYYTPPQLVERLVAGALDPVIAERLQRHKADPETALLGIRVVDPACGSGHFLLAAARRLAQELARLRHLGDAPDEIAFRHALRDVVRHCIHGVDLNPLAVELCRTGLWLESVEPGKPLGFLAANIRRGNALVGLADPALLEKGIPADAYKAIPGDDKKTAAALRKAAGKGRGQRSLNFGDPWSQPTTSGLANMDEDDPAQVAARREAWHQHRNSPAFQRDLLLANLFTAAFFAVKTPENYERVPGEQHLDAVKHGEPLDPAVSAYAEELAQRHHFFHWHLEFTEAHNNGGFDCVLGNPPWDKLQFEEKPYFATRRPAIAEAANAAVRRDMIEDLALGNGVDQRLYETYQHARRAVDTTAHFVRRGGRYPLTGKGKMNLYALFAEHALAVTSKAGRAGLLLPSGIATDDTTSAFFAHLVEGLRLAAFHDFENRKAIFPAVHRSYKFALLILGSGIEEADFSFFNSEVADMADPRRRFSLTPEEIVALNPNSRNCPVFRARRDADITTKIYENACILIDKDPEKPKNPWQVDLRRFLNMADDSELFTTHEELSKNGSLEGNIWTLEGTRFVPLYEAKMIHHYDHRWASYDEAGQKTRNPVDLEKDNTEFLVQPRYWVDENVVTDWTQKQGWPHEWFLVWRDVCRSTDERTLIPGFIPKVTANHKIPMILKRHEPKLIPCLYGNLCSMVLDYAARQKIGGTSMAYFILEQLPILPPEHYSPEQQAYIRERVVELVYTAVDMEPFARDMGYEGPPFGWNPELRAQRRAELDALYAHLYGLDEEELAYILDPADVMGADYPSETFRVLKDKEKRQYGRYRTRDLILEAFRAKEFPT